MFGMLDYRAHKLYFIIFSIPNLFIMLFSLYALPLINYSIGLALADGRIFQVLISLASVFILELIWLMIVMGIISKSFEFIFSLFVDIIPHDGRTKEEAQMVVWKGDKAIRSLAISQHPSTWTDELIYEIPKDDWVQNIFFKQQTIRRLELIKEHYEFSPDDVPYTDSEINRVLAENDAEIQWQEKVFANAYSRRMVIGYSFLFLLLLFNPFG